MILSITSEFNLTNIQQDGVFFPSFILTRIDSEVLTQVTVLAREARAFIK